MLRERYKSVEHWDELVATILNGVNRFDQYGRYKTEIQISEHAGPLNRLFSTYTTGWMEQVGCRYSRGDELSAIKIEAIDEGVERYTKLAGEIEILRNKMDLPTTFFYGTLLEPHQLQDAYTLLSWLICFDIDSAKLTTLEPFIAPEGKDRIVDTVLARYQPEREIADTCACPRTHRLLESMLDANPKKQIALAEQYLERWAKLMSSLRGMGIISGAGRTKGAKSNDDLAKLAEHGSFKGFWAWDLALLVRILEVDDSSFADHDLYPSDLAHFKA